MKCKVEWCDRTDMKAHGYCQRHYKQWQTSRKIFKTHLDLTFEERFWRFVGKGEEDECWPWKGARLEAGYGHFVYNKQPLKAHRVSFEITHGKIPEGLCVLHKCDNPPCVNPKHLYAGTHKQNSFDRDSKNRGAKGETQGASKLTTAEVLEIRRLHASGKYNQKDIATMFNCNHSNVNQIVNRKSWKHI